MSATVNRQSAKIAKIIDDEFFALPSSKRPHSNSVILFVDARFGRSVADIVVRDALSIIGELMRADNAWLKHISAHKQETDPYDNRLRKTA